MGSDDELPEDEEEILVYVEFEGLVNGNAFSEEQLQLDMIGMDTEHPIMQINGRFYEGTYEDINGTCMFFVKDDNSTVNDSVFDATSNLRYFAKTRKSLKMQRIFIKSRTEFLGDSEHHHCIPNLNTLKQAGVPLLYHEQALSFWNTMRNNRLDALHSYLEKQRIRQQKRSQGIALESESDEDNPFAIYKDKEDSNNVNETEDIRVELKKESNSRDNQLGTKFMHSNETKDKIPDTTENTSEDNIKEFVAPIEPQPSVSSVLKDKTQYSIKSVRTCRINVSQKKRTSVTHNANKLKHKTKQSLCKGKTVASGRKKRMLPDEEKQSEELDESNVIKSSLSLEITENENDKISEYHKEPVIEESEAGIDERDSTNDKIMRQRKREAKMKEIAERLKAVAEEHRKANVDLQKCT